MTTATATTATIEPGVHPGIPEAEYRAWPFPSASMLADLADEDVVSPKQWKYDQEHPKEETESMTFGSAVHCLLLEPDRFHDEYAIGGPINPKTGEPFGEKTKAFAEWAAEQGKPHYLPTDKALNVAAAVKAIQDTPKAMRFLQGGRAEVSCVWDCHWRGDDGPAARLKFRPDYIPDPRVLVNIKTSATIQPTIFARRSIIDFFYDGASALYADGWEALTDEKPVTMLIIVQNVAPWDVVVRPMGPDALTTGRELYRRAIERWWCCSQSGEWPGHDRADDWTPLDVPTWRVQQVMNPAMKGT